MYVVLSFLENVYNGDAENVENNVFIKYNFNV